MLGLFLRKNFYEGWDNVVYFLVPNLLMDLVVLLASLAMWFGKEYLLVWGIAILVSLILLSILSLAWGEISNSIVNYDSIEFVDFFKKIPSCILDGVFLGITYFVLFVLTFFGVQYYFQKGATFVGLMAGCMFCWIAVTIFMALQWFIPIRCAFHNKFGKTFKKCFIVLINNLPFSIFIIIYNLFLCVVSIIMIGLAPGICGVIFARSNAFRLILKKYDYIEEVQKEDASVDVRKIKIPWKQILEEDNEMVGKRTFKNFFMPWKE